MFSVASFNTFNRCRHICMEELGISEELMVYAWMKYMRDLRDRKYSYPAGVGQAMDMLKKYIIIEQEGSGKFHKQKELF